MKWLIEYREGRGNTFWTERPHGGIVIAEDAYSALKESNKTASLVPQHQYRVTQIPTALPVVFSYIDPNPLDGWKVIS